MNKISLNGIWNASGTNPFTNDKIMIEGLVPGSTLNDIINSGVEQCDIFYRDNAEKFQKYERYNWIYSKEFEIAESDEIKKLVFERLDTYCDIYLNENYIAHCDNGHISYSFDVTDIIKNGKNELKLHFYSPVNMTDGKPECAGAFTTERMYTRRTQCSFGWDWVARLVSCGICGDVYIEQYGKDEVQIDSVYVYTKSIDSYGAYIGIKINFAENFSGKVYDFQIYDDCGNMVKSHSKYCRNNKYAFNVSIEDAKLWYPVGYGSQPIYELKVMCRGKELHTEKFGIRTVKVLQTTDEPGSENYNKCLKLKESEFSKEYDHNTEFSGFILVVNGTKIMCRGANWVPCEPFENGKTKEKTKRILKMAKDMGLNMLRVWGGGSFETKEFYDECSRLGIMVTQDFLMACGSYPEKQSWFIEHLNKEAEYAAKLMRNQPCLMWWSGDNENAVNGDDVMEDHLGRSSAEFGIQPILMELDPERDFFPSSPYGGSFFASNTCGTTHNTQFLSYVFDAIDNLELDDYKDLYKRLCARFIAEEPTFGLVSTYSLRKFLTDEDIFGDDLSLMQYHTKSNPAMKKEIFGYLLTLSQKLLGEFKNADDRNFKMQYVQYECVRVSLEQLRREMWFLSGVIFWMMADCWPASSGWTFVDYYLMPKASYYSFKRCSKPVICSIDKENNKYSVYASNSALSLKRGEISVFILDTKTGERQAVYNDSFCIDAEARSCIHSFEYSGDSMIIAEIKGEDMSDTAFYKIGALNIQKTDIEYKIYDNKIVFKSKGYVHAVGIDGNILPEDNFFSMLPGEEKEVEYEKAFSGERDIIEIVAYGIEER